MKDVITMKATDLKVGDILLIQEDGAKAQYQIVGFNTYKPNTIDLDRKDIYCEITFGENSLYENSILDNFMRNFEHRFTPAHRTLIAALQEMSSKRSRMAAAQLHEAYKDAVRMEIEVEREFNLLPREVLVTIDGERRKETFESAMLQKETELGNRIPIEFAISIKVQRENKWSVLAQNELVLQMVQLQVIRPDQALELMHFEGKESIIQRAAQAQPDPRQTQEAQAQMQKQAMKNEMQNQIQQMPAPEEVFA